MVTSDLKVPSNVGMGIKVAIDASRNRSGGARAHLIGILNAENPESFGVSEVHLWSYKELLDSIPEYSWLKKHCPVALNKSLPHQLLWQYRSFPKEILREGCDVLLSTDAGTVCPFQPSLVMSRDMLSFEGGEMERYSLFSFQRIRLWLLKHMQVRSLKKATGALFLTEYAAKVIQRFSGPLAIVRIVPHGISDKFRRALAVREWNSSEPITCTYVSNVDLYKHQWHVVKAMAKLRKLGFPVELKLVGGGQGSGRHLLDKAIQQLDPSRSFVEEFPKVKHDQIPEFLAKADIFIFASSCENMPNTLVEAMASGLPIACSDRGPMPEILQDAGVYFNPEDSDSIVAAVAALASNYELRIKMAQKALSLSNLYSWRRCAQETWNYLVYISKKDR